jgi:hypothetical protein
MRFATFAFGTILASAAPATAQQPAAPAPEHPGPRLGGPTVDGSVVRTAGCGAYFIVTYHSEYALAQWVGGQMVRDNDVLEGHGDLTSFEREGPMTFTNLSTGQTIDVVIEKTLMNQAELSQAEARYCR